MVEQRKKLHKHQQSKIHYNLLKNIKSENQHIIKKYIDYRLKDNSDVTISRINRLIRTFAVVALWFDKPFTKITKKDCDTVIRGLKQDKFFQASIDLFI